jgi:hypothetical protein
MINASVNVISHSRQKPVVNLISPGFTSPWHNCLFVNDFLAEVGRGLRHSRVQLPCYRDRQGQQRRPFSEQAEIRCRACSLPLQRYIVDFAADTPFCPGAGEATGAPWVEIGINTIRRVSLAHAKGHATSNRFLSTGRITCCLSRLMTLQ